MSKQAHALGITLLLLLLAAPLAAKGPPWVSVEYPANPHDRATRDAILVFHSYHHGASVAAQVTARAIGSVDGRRTSVPLRVTETGRPGVYAVHGDLADAPAWVIQVTSQATVGNARATALVALGRDQRLLTVSVPHNSVEGGTWRVPRDPTPDEVDAMLRTAVAMSDAAVRVADTEAAFPVGVAVGAALLLLLPVGVVGARRSRR